MDSRWDVIQALTPHTLEQIQAWPSFTIPERRFAPDSPGIYCAIIDDGWLAYVGITATSLRQRWGSHHLKLILPDMGATRLHYQVLADEHVLFRVELAIIAHFNPILNGWSPSRIAMTIGVDGRKTFRREDRHECHQYW